MSWISDLWQRIFSKPVHVKAGEPVKVAESIEGKVSQTISAAGMELIKAFEGCQLHAYKDSVGVPTIGWGRITNSDGTRVRMGQTCTQAEADAWLMEDVEKEGCHYVRHYFPEAIAQCRFDALSSFCYNRGAGRLKQLIAMPGNIADNMLAFDWAGADRKVLLGLQRRRRSERAMYLNDLGKGRWQNWMEWKPYPPQAEKPNIRREG